MFFHRDNVTEVCSTSPLFPTVKKVSGWKAPTSHIPELELFLDSVKTELFDPGNVRFTRDNLSVGERQALASLRQVDNVNVQIQDKGSKFVVIDKSDYDSKMKEQLENPLHYQKLEQDPSADYVGVITQWSERWLEKGQINEEIANWVLNGNTKPGKGFGTIKTHKQGNPIRLITSFCSTTIKNLSAFTEFYLKPLSQNLPSFVKDTTHFLQRI